MKRIINYRFLLFSALALCAGICTGGFLFRSLLMSIMIPIASVALGICLFFIKKKHTVWLLFLAFAIGVSAFLVDHTLTKTDLNGLQTVELHVESVKESSGEVIFGGDFSGYACCYDKSLELSEGDTVLITGEFEETDFSFSDGYAMRLYAKRVVCRVKVKEATVLSNNPTFFQRIRIKCRKVMQKYMNNDDVAVAMSLLFGDKSTLSKETAENVADAGLAHVFAVSGLHIGFLAAVFTCILKKLGVGKKQNLICNIVLLILYGFLTGMHAGVKRAIIMYAVYAFSSLVARKRDQLTSLSAATILILLTDPRELFEVGFIMSVGAVAGIFLFFDPLYRDLSKKIGFPPLRYAYGTVCMTLSANIFVLPVTFSVFGVFAPYSILGNIVVLPIVTVLFPCLIFTALLSVVYSGFGVLYYVVKYPVIAIRVISLWISSLPGARIAVAGLGVATIFYVLFFICASRFVLLKIKPKVALCSVFAALTIITMLLPF